MNTALSVMVGLVPTIHVFTSLVEHGGQDVDARHKGEHDELERRRGHGFRARRFAPPRKDSGGSAQQQAVVGELLATHLLEQA